MSDNVWAAFEAALSDDPAAPGSDGSQPPAHPPGEGQPLPLERLTIPDPGPVAGFVSINREPAAAREDRLAGESLEAAIPGFAHLRSQVEQLVHERLPLLRHHANPSCDGCRMFLDAYERLLAHLVALEEASTVSAERYERARADMVRSTRESFPEQADEYENRAAKPRSLESLSATDLTNVLPVFAAQLRDQCLERGESAGRSTETRLKDDIKTLTAHRESLLSRVEASKAQLASIEQRVTVAMDALGVSGSIVERFIAGNEPFEGLIATAVANNGGLVAVRHATGKVWLSATPPEDGPPVLPAAKPVGSSLFGAIETVAPGTVKTDTGIGDTTSADAPPAATAPVAGGGGAKPAGPGGRPRPGTALDDTTAIVVKAIGTEGLFSVRTILAAHPELGDADGVSAAVRPLIQQGNEKISRIPNRSRRQPDALLLPAVGFDRYASTIPGVGAMTIECTAWVSARRNKSLPNQTLTTLAPAVCEILDAGYTLGSPRPCHDRTDRRKPIALHFQARTASTVPAHGLLIYAEGDAPGVLPDFELAGIEVELVWLCTPNPRRADLPAALSAVRALAVPHDPIDIASDRTVWELLK